MISISLDGVATGRTRPTAVLRAACGMLALCSVVLFLLITFWRPTPWYINDQEFIWARNNMTLPMRGVDVLTKVVKGKDGKPKVELAGRDTPLLSGANAFVISTQWGAVMLATVAAAGFMQASYWSPTSIADGRSSASTAVATLGGLSAGWTSFKRKVRRVASYQLPPYDVWNWLCGGMNVLDAFLVLAWSGLAVLYLYYQMDRKFKATAVAFSPPAPGSPPPAKPVPYIEDPTPSYVMRRLEAAGKSFGEVLRGTLGFMFFPVSRSSFLQWLTGEDFSSLIKYHRWMAWGNMLLMCVHGVLYMTLWGAEGDFEHQFSWSHEDGRVNIVGLVSFICGALIMMTSVTWVRKHYFKVFYRTHIIGFLGFLIFGMAHYKGFVYWIAPALVFYALDRAFRYWQLMCNWTSLGPQHMCVDGNVMTLTLTFARKVATPILPGQTVYLRVPAVSFLESHPFTIADVDEGDQNVTRVTVHIRAGGFWTRAVQKLVAVEGRTVRLQVQGPYISQLEFVQSSPVVVMIAGGIGITPVLGVLRRLLSLTASTDHTTTTSMIPQVYLTWCSRSLCELRLLGADLLTAMMRGNSSTPKSSDGVKTALKSMESDSNSSSAANWLHGELFYTGFEQEQLQQAVEIKKEQPATEKTVDTTAPRALSQHPSSVPWLFAVSAVLAFFGAWAGLLVATYYDAYYQRTTAEGSNSLAVGVLQFFCIAAGAILPTLGLLAIVRLFTRTTPSDTKWAHTATMAKWKSLVTLPGYIMAPATASDEGLMLQRGRPNIRAMLRRVMSEHSELKEIDVLVAGPDSMYNAVQAICAELAESAENTPALVCKRVAHIH